MNKQLNNEAHSRPKKENTSLYFVVWVQGEKKPQAAATDPTAAEEIAAEICRNCSRLTFITKENTLPEGLPIDRRTAEEATGFYTAFVQDEQRRSACRCCANCGNFITEYGETFCRLDAIPKTADPLKFSCHEWV